MQEGNKQAEEVTSKLFKQMSTAMAILNDIYKNHKDCDRVALKAERNRVKKAIRAMLDLKKH